MFQAIRALSTPAAHLYYEFSSAVGVLTPQLVTFPITPEQTATLAAWPRSGQQILETLNRIPEVEAVAVSQSELLIKLASGTDTPARIERIDAAILDGCGEGSGAALFNTARIALQLKPAYHVLQQLLKSASDDWTINRNLEDDPQDYIEFGT